MGILKVNRRGNRIHPGRQAGCYIEGRRRRSWSWTTREHTYSTSRTADCCPAAASERSPGPDRMRGETEPTAGW